MTKWYYELSALLLLIIIGIIIVFSTDFNFEATVVPVENPITSNSVITKTDSLRAKWAEGKNVFKSNCASCHNPKADGTGPPLQGATARWAEAGKYKGKTGEQWLKLWIRNCREVVSAGYPYGVAMAGSRATEMNIFSNLQDKDIDALLMYVESQDAGYVNRNPATMP